MVFNRKLALVGIIPNQILRCVFSSDPAVSSSIFVGAEREENLTNGLVLRCCEQGTIRSAQLPSCSVIDLVKRIASKKWSLAQNKKRRYKFEILRAVSKSS